MNRSLRKLSPRDWDQLLAALIESLQGWPEFSKESLALPEFVVADGEKVAPHILTWRRHRPDRQLSAEEAAHYERILHKRRILESELAAIAAVAEQSRVTFTLQRGLAFQAYYPSKYIRQFNDLDIAVASIRDLSCLLPVLFKLGYFIARPIVLRRSTTGDPWVGIAFNKQRADLNEPVMLDVSVGGPSMSAITHWKLPEAAWESRCYIEVGNMAVPILSPTFNLLALFVEAFERDDLYLRDLLDLDRLAQQELDLDRIREMISTLRLGLEVSRFQRITQRARLPHLRSFFDQIGTTASMRPPSVPNKLSRFLGHVAPLMLQQSLPRAAAGLVYDLLIPLVDVLENLFPQVLLRVYRKIPPEAAHHLGLPVYLFFDPAKKAAGVDGELTFQKVDDLTYVAIAGQLYFCRVRPLIDEDELDLMAGSAEDE